MTEITDAKKLLDDGQRTEASIYDLVSFSVYPNDIVAIQYQIEHVPETVKECREMIKRLFDYNSGTKTFKLRNELRRMIMRLEAAIMYAKNHFKLDEPMNT
jgi:hypothetical protein